MNTKYSLHTCETDEQMDEAFRLRYLAYTNVEAITENLSGEFSDSYDFLENSNTCLVYENENAVASLRACIYSTDDGYLKIPAFEVYRNEIERSIGLDNRIVEFNRFVIHPDKAESKVLFKLPFSFTVLNVLKFKADYAICAVRLRHVSLYEKFFGMKVISGPKRYPGLNVEMVLMAVECHENLPLVTSREECFRFTLEEVEAYLSSAHQHSGDARIFQPAL